MNKTVPITSLVMPSNVRVDLALEQSIKELGLLMPITVFQRGDVYYVYDGRVRALACSRIGHQTIDVEVY